ncbi:hypothetical protein Tsubulata_050124 [Turnera subulata]|uniref:Uncharacterized protein n=1 Tax=Turnera subulata TaxID=218843 RepID=A0A9Q0F0F4_9ROSI|nr:hypothetical protein Tsubulata_050124 [Turnera subulata]
MPLLLLLLLLMYLFSPSLPKAMLIPMLKLAQLLRIAGLDITFLNSEYNHERLVRHANIQERFAQYPGFCFRTIPDGLLADHPRSGVAVKELFESLNTRVKPILKDMLDEIRPRVTCIVGDGFVGFVVEVANELGIPIISFRTASACSFWVYSLASSSH